MKNFKIITDSGCDLSYDMVKKLDVGYIGLVCEIEGKQIIEDCGRTLSYKDFYNKVSNGAMPVTSQINPNRFYEEFEKHLKEGYDIIYISFSSQLSGTYNSSLIAREELLEEYKDSKIVIIDSLSASSGHGLLVYKACCLKEEGKNIEEIAECIEEYKNKLYAYFTVKDLKHLQRGGRISGMTAMVGSMFNINPIMTITDGKLESIGKVRGEKKALKELIKNMDEKLGDKDLKEVFISHADDDKSVEFLIELIREKYSPENIYVNYMGLAVGSHTGKGAVAIFFLEQSR